MTDDARSPLASIGSVIRGLFPWLPFVTLDPASGGVRLRAEADRVHLAGADGDPAVLRAGADTGGRLYRDTVTGILYYSPSPTAAYVAVASGIVAPLPATPGTTIALGPGSAKVTCG